MFLNKLYKEYTIGQESILKERKILPGRNELTS
jgi:hypothetical protein